MRLTLLTILLVIDDSTTDIIRRAIFECRRVDVAFCCTSRVRILCAEQCKDVKCGVQNLISRFQMVSMTPPPSARDGLVQFSRPSAPTPLVEHLQESSTQRPFSATSLAQSPLTGFPTLIPFEPNIDSIPNIDKPASRSQSTSVPVLHSTVIKSIHHRIRTTPDPRIIQPPESLVIIGETDEEPTTTDNWHQPKASSSSPSSGLVNALIFPQLANTSGGVSLPNSFISEEVSDSKLHSGGDSSGWTTQRRFCALVMNPRRCRTRARLFTARSNGLDRRKTFVATAVLLPPSPLPAPLHHQRLLRHKLSRPSKGWNAKTLPAQKVVSWPDAVETLPRFFVGGSASTSVSTDNKDSSPFIKGFSVGPSNFHGQFGFTDPSDIDFFAQSRTTLSPFRFRMKPLRPFSPALKSSANRGLSQQTSSHQISFERSLAFTNQPTPKAPPNPQPQSFTMTMSVVEQQCGVVPNFKPCVSAEQASHALLECCRRKNLPHGCLSLCRYDITQAEVRSAIDRGLCGLFSVAPYLECASQGHDNTECCRHKGIIAKTGPQCEQFCRPSHQLGVLGLQHIVCGNAIGEMMQCHHSGIRL